MTPNKLIVYFVADMVLADMVVADMVVTLCDPCLCALSARYCLKLNPLNLVLSLG